MNYELQILSAEFFRTQFSIRHSQFSIATAPLFFHTACVCSEKNYRLQDIQLSKNPPTLPLELRRGKPHKRPANLVLVASQPKPRITRSPQARQRLVENTGLEPVTSWLQTRRSPS
jgi:hypothetical protein